MVEILTLAWYDTLLSSMLTFQRFVDVSNVASETGCCSLRSAPILHTNTKLTGMTGWLQNHTNDSDPEDSGNQSQQQDN